MAATYWVNNIGSEYSVMDDTTMTIYSYNYVDDFSGNFYYYSYYLNDPYNQLGIFPGGNNYYTWTSTHSEVFDPSDFANYQNIVRSRFVNAKDTYTTGNYYFATARENYVRQATNSKTFIGKGFSENDENVAQGANISPDPAVGRYYTIFFQAISGGKNQYAPDLQRVVDAQARSGAFSISSKEVQNDEQSRVVAYFQAAPYGDGGGGGRIYEIYLASDPEGTKGACGGANYALYFIDSLRLEEATKLSIDEKLQKFAKPSYYSDGNVVRFWDGREFSPEIDFCYY
jgi:hypothetical protein